jgi:hypothetical protein
LLAIDFAEIGQLLRLAGGGNDLVTGLGQSATEFA